MRNERIVISRQRLLDEVWGYDPFSTTNTIEVFVSNLRRKLEAEGEPRLAAHDPRSGLRPSGVTPPVHPGACAHVGARCRTVSVAFDRLPIRTRLAVVSALLTFAILCGFALVVGSLTVHAHPLGLQPRSRRLGRAIRRALQADRRQPSKRLASTS